MNFEAEITELVERCPGSRGAAIVDPDGIPVVTIPRQLVARGAGGGVRADRRAAWTEAGREFEHGSLQQFSVWAEDASWC